MFDINEALKDWQDFLEIFKSNYHVDGFYPSLQFDVSKDEFIDLATLDICNRVSYHPSNNYAFADFGKHETGRIVLVTDLDQDEWQKLTDDLGEKTRVYIVTSGKVDLV